MVSYSSGSGFVFIRGWFCAARRWNVIKWYNLLVIQMKGGRFVCCCSIFMIKEHSSLESLDSVSVGWYQSAAFHNQQRIFLVWDKTYDFLNISKSLELHFLAWSPEKKNTTSTTVVKTHAVVASRLLMQRIPEFDSCCPSLATAVL